MNPKKKKGGVFSLLERTSNYIFQLYESDLAFTTEMVQSVKITNYLMLRRETSPEEANPCCRCD